MIATYFMSTTKSLNQIYFLRFVCGLFMNINNVGKAFIFEIAHKDLQQWGFSFKNIFGIIASFASPIVGFKLYNYLNKDFFQVCVYVALLYFISIIFYYLTFYILFTPSNDKKEDDEEQKILLHEDT